jgi:hypothetical protein
MLDPMDIHCNFPSGRSYGLSRVIAGVRVNKPAGKNLEVNQEIKNGENL